MAFSLRWRRPVAAWMERRALATNAPSALASACALALLVACGPEPPPIAVPADLDRLEPQLAAYVRERIEQVRKEPSDPSRRADLAMTYAVNQLWSEARNSFSNLVQLQPEEPLAHLYLGVATLELGDLAAALDQFRAAAARFPSFPQAHYRVGDTALRLGDIEQAVSAFEELIELAPQEWRGYAGLGDARLRQGDAREAVKLLERAVALAPESKIARHLLGLAYRQVGQDAAAARNLSSGLDSLHYPMPDPWSENAVRHIKLLPAQIDAAHEFLAAGRARDAIELLAAAGKWRPQDPNLLNALGVAFLAVGAPDQARQVLDQSIAAHPEHLLSRLTQIEACLDLGRPGEALREAEIARKLAPDLPQPYLATANVHLAQGQGSEAIENFQAAFERDPQNAYILVDMGDAFARLLDRPREAANQYLRALELRPDLTLARLRLAEAYIQAGETNLAAAALDAARARDPGAPGIAEIEARLRSH